MKLSEIMELHPDWNIVVSTTDMDLELNCASCGQKVSFGDTYTSFEQTTDNGFFGLPVCPDCYNKELKRKGRPH